MKIAFRTDASGTIGTGHVMRCLNLAAALAADGADVVFVCRQLAGNFGAAIEARGFRVLTLPAPELPVDFPPDPDDEVLPAHAAWLETTWSRDALETAAVIEAALGSVDWLVVDHYALPARWESMLRRVASRIMVIDDLIDRPHDCDLLLNQNLIGGGEHYAALVPGACSLLLGPGYALLPAEYGDLRDRVPPREGRARRVLIYFGGVDENNLTGRSLAAVLARADAGLMIDVVVPVLGPHRHAIERIAAGKPQVYLHHQLPSLAALLAAADIAFGAAGSTSWERLCLGLPSLVVSLSENQRMIARTLDEHGLGHWLGHHDEVDDARLASKFCRLVEVPLDTAWSMRCRAACDGRGARRVAALLRYSPGHRLTARSVRIEDLPSLAEALPQLGLPPATATAARALRDLGANRFYAVEAAPGASIAIARLQAEGDGWRLSTAALAAVRGREPGDVVAAAIGAHRGDDAGTLSWLPAAAGPGLRIAICSDAGSWLNDFIPALVAGWLARGHRVDWTHDAALLAGGELCFFLSYGRIVKSAMLERFRHNLVVHESDLPAGRGWSPMTWQVVEGADEYRITLFEAAAAVDAGVIYLQSTVRLDGTELVDVLRQRQADATLALCRDFVDGFPAVVRGARAQTGTPSYYPRRTPADSRFDPQRPLAEQFDLLRVCDNRRYPAWFELRGHKYLLNIHASGERTDQ